jgi:hypothetical protein
MIARHRKNRLKGLVGRLGVGKILSRIQGAKALDWV